MKKTSYSHTSLFIVSLTIFFDMLGFGMLLPLMPKLLLGEGGRAALIAPNISDQAHFVFLGVFIALFPLAQLFATPILGDISDSVGRKKVLLASIAGTLFSYVLLIFGILNKSLLLLAISRVLDGISGGNLSVAQASVADISNPKNRARNFAFLSAAYGLGFVLGPLLTIQLIPFIERGVLPVTAPFFIATVLSALNLILLSVFFSETRKTKKSTTISFNQSILHLKQALQMKGIRLYFAVNFFLQGSFATLTTFLSVFVITRLGLTQEQFGFVLSYLGIWMAVGQILFTKQFAKHFGELPGFYITLFGLFISTLVLFLPRTFLPFLVITPFVAIFLGVAQALLVTLVSASATNEMQGEVLGINTSVTAIAHTLPPIVGGLGAAAFSASTPILFVSLGAFVSLALVHRRMQTSKQVVYYK